MVMVGHGWWVCFHGEGGGKRAGRTEDWGASLPEREGGGRGQGGEGVRWGSGRGGWERGC